VIFLKSVAQRTGHEAGLLLLPPNVNSGPTPFKQLANWKYKFTVLM
jgi:hypothetical protein